MRNDLKRRLFGRLALCLTLAAVAAPTAQARVDGSSEWSGPGKGGDQIPAVSGARSTGAPADEPEAPTRNVSADDGFDWAASGIGAGMALVVVLLGADALVTARHLRRQAAA